MNAPHVVEGPATDSHELDHHMHDYRRIIVTLTVATGVEFGISYAISQHHLGLAAGILVLVAIAFFKAVLVAKFFMHLRYDPKFLGFVAITPLVLATPLNLIGCLDAGFGPAI